MLSLVFVDLNVRISRDFGRQLTQGIKIKDHICILPFQEIHNKVRPEKVELIRRDYVANGGWETFLSYEDPEQVGIIMCFFFVFHRAFFCLSRKRWKCVSRE